MSQADELLAGLDEIVSVNDNSEQRIVIGDDRFITVPDSLKRIAVQYDHNIETVTFECPRYWDNHDMSQMRIYINYMLPNETTGQYMAKNIVAEGQTMTFDWTISRNVTRYKGKISFLICIKKTDNNGNEEHHWGTELNRDLYISEGLECGPTIVSKYPDIITQLLKKMEDIEAIGGIAGESAYEVAVSNGFEGDETEWLASLKGETGNSGYTGSIDELEIVNNLTAGGPTAALSAEMGKELNLKLQTMSLESVTWDTTQNESGFLESGGMSVSNNSGYTATPYIDVSEYSEVYVTAKTGQVHGTVFGYDAEQNYITTMVARSATLDKTKVDVPNDVVYIRINSQSAIYLYRPVYHERIPMIEDNVESNKNDIAEIKSGLLDTDYSLVTWDTSANDTSGFLKPDGVTISSYNGYVITPFIDVTDYEYLLVTTKSGQGINTVFGYDVNETFMSVLLGQNDGTEKHVSIPDGVTYIRVSSSVIPTIKRPIYTNKFVNIQSDINSNAEAINEIKLGMYNAEYEYLDNGSISNGWLLATGEINSYSGSYFVTDFVEVTEGETYYVDATANAAGITVGGYGSDKNFIMQLLALGSYDKQEIVIPAGISYVRVSSKTSYPSISYLTYSPKVDSVIDDINVLKTDLYTAYKKLSYDENELFYGFIGADGISQTSYGGYYATPYIDVSSYDAVYVDTSVTNSGIKSIFCYDSGNMLMNALPPGEYKYNEIVIAGTQIKYIRINGQGVVPAVYIKSVGTAATKKKINKNVNWVGMSIWWYDSRTLADVEDRGGGVIAKGYQTLLKAQYEFLSDTNYCYSGNSLGAASENASTCLMYKANEWAASENSIWTLDTITNDFKLNVPIGTIDDYNNKTGLLTYYGALREFADKVKELSGDDAIVIASNALHRNNGGATSTSQNGNGNTLIDYEKALTYACMVNGWWYVDQYRLCGINDDTLYYATIDGLHLNNLGYRMAVVPWSQVFEIIYSQLMG